VAAGGSALAVAGLVDQRRRERRLIQKAPADSATRTPIHPAKRSSEDRCIVSGSSIEDERTRDSVWSHRPREPQRTSGSASRPFPARTSPLAPEATLSRRWPGCRSSRMRKRRTGFTVEVLQGVVLLRSEIRRRRRCPVELPANDEMWGLDSRSSARRIRAVHGCQQVVIARVRWWPPTAHSVRLCAVDGGEPRCESGPLSPRTQRAQR
jgi:hypothetical protein